MGRTLTTVRALPPWVHTGVILGGYFLGAYLISLVALIFSPSPEPALIFPGIALDLALLLIFGLAYLPALFVAPFVGAALATLFGTPTLPVFSGVLLGYALIKLVVYGGAAWFLLRVKQIDTRLSRLRDISWFLFVASFVAPFFAAVLNEVDFYLAGFVTWDELRVATLTFWAGDATGVAMLAPLLLSLQSRDTLLAVHRTRRARLTFLVSAALLLVAIWFAYAQPNDGRIDYSYLVFAPLILVAVRCGFRRTALAVFLLNAGVVVAVSYRLTSPEVTALQFNLMAASYLSLLLAGLFDEYHRNRERLHHTAYHDRLTGLPNRAYFLERLAQLNAEPGHLYAVLFLDLDHFKRVNDAFGHAVGDALLTQLAGRMKACLRPEDTLARLGGDEFAVLLPRVDSGQTALKLTDCLNQKLRRAARVADFEGYDITTQASIGVALGRAGQDNSSDVLRNADTAMHEARFMGQVTLFDEAMERRLQERLGLERDLKHALRRGELSIVYQPIVSLESDRLELEGRTVGSESLMRWQHPTKGTISPDVFIPIAEETGLIHELGRWLLHTALAEARTWQAHYNHEYSHEHPNQGHYVTVNLSVRQLQRREFALEVREALERHRFPPECLVLEVTETMLMTDIETNIAVLKSLTRLGVRIAMDDFGTGYASLSYLKRIPLDILKIDRSFLEGVPADPSNTTLVRTILAMAHSLGLDVVAEGVETANQEAFLLKHGCQKAQGYFYGVPNASPTRVQSQT